jgi:hypothetical protein
MPAVLSVTAVGISLVATGAAVLRQRQTPTELDPAAVCSVAGLLSAGALAATQMQVFPAATTASAVAVIVGLPVAASGIFVGLNGRMHGRRNYPRWWWYLWYTAFILSLVLLGLAAADFAAPARLGTIPHLHVPIVTAGAVVLAALPHGPAWRRAAAFGALGAAVSAAIVVLSFADFAPGAELTIALGFVAGVGVLNVTRRSPTPVPLDPGIYAAQTLAIDARVAALACAIGVLVVVDTVIRVP